MRLVGLGMRALISGLLVVFMGGCSVTAMKLSVVNSIAKLGDYAVYRDVVYHPLQGQTLDVYLPTALSSSGNQRVNHNTSGLPVVVFFYGGCWGGCETLDKSYYTFVGEALTSMGYVAVLPDYRLYPNVNFPQMIDDARVSVEWVRKNIASYGGDGNALIVMGHSAGAHLAAMLALDERYLQPDTRSALKGFVGLAGPYDFLPLTKAYQQVVFGPPTRYREGQPIAFVDGSEPPLLLLYGTADSTVKPKNMRNLAVKVEQFGGEVTAKSYEGVDHGVVLGALSELIRGRYTVYRDIENFLHDITKQ